MTSSQHFDEAPPLVCPVCKTEMTRIAITAAGEVISCEDCAARRGLTAQVLSLEEWEARDAVLEVLGAYRLTSFSVSKQPRAPTQEPRAHVWYVEDTGKRFLLKRYHAWLETSAIRYEHSVLAYLAKRQMPVAAPLPTHDGQAIAEAGNERWALYPALEGSPVTAQEWMWRVPRAAETLAGIHLALQDFTPEGAPHPDWDAWTLARVDSLLAQWPPLPPPAPDWVAEARARLAGRYLDEASAQLPKTIVHGDFGVSNLLWRGDQVTGILDFEKAHPDTVLFDFGWGIGTRHPPLVRAVVATYTRVRPLSALEREMMPEAMLIGALQAIHVQAVTFGNQDEAARRAQDLFFLLRDAEALRRAVALKVG
jgi:homoserine kinase type II